MNKITGKYLKDLGIKEKDTPQGWCPNDYRQEYWAKQREEYGFDERETWSLDLTFHLWLYERLSMYNKINIINTSFHQFEYKGETINLQDCIDRMLEGLRIALTTDWFNRTKEQNEKVTEITELFALCYYFLWW